MVSEMKIAKVLLIFVCLFYTNLAFADKSFILSGLKQETWQWQDMQGHDLNNVNIHVFEIVDVISSDALAEKIFNRFKIFKQVQIIKDTYILSGEYLNNHVLAQIFPAKNNLARAYISVLKTVEQKYEPILDLLPQDRKIIYSFGNNQEIVAIANTKQNITSLYASILDKVVSNKYKLNNKFSSSKYFYISLNDKNIEIHASRNKNQTTIALVSRLNGDL